MATWVDTDAGNPTSSGGNISLYIYGGYANVTRNGNTVSGNIGVKWTMRTSGSNTYTYNTIAAQYSGTKRYAQISSQNYQVHTENGKSYYANATSGNAGYQNTTEVCPWSFSTTVSGDEAGSLSISFTAGWNDWAGTQKHTYTFSVPYPRRPEVTVPLYIYKQDKYGNYGDAVFWKNQTVSYGGTLNETWSPSGEEAYCYNSANISETNVTTTSNRYGYATRKKYYLDLNGRLDGSDSNSIGTYGTFSVKINGETILNNVNDYYTEHYYETTFDFVNINPTIGHTYKGVVEGSASGTITRETNTRLSFVTNQVYAKDPGNHQYKPGDLYVKRNGSWTRAAKSGYDSLIYRKTNGSWQRIDG